MSLKMANWNIDVTYKIKSKKIVAFAIKKTVYYNKF